MKELALGPLFIVLILTSATFVKADSPSPLQQEYLNIYLTVNDAEKLQKENDYLGALVCYKIALPCLIEMHKSADWEPALFNKRIQDCKDAIAKLTSLATKQLLDQPKLADPAGPDKSALFDDGFRLKKEQKYWGALYQFERYATIVEIMRHIDSKWDTPLTAKRLDQAQAEIERIENVELPLGISQSNKKPAAQ